MGDMADWINENAELCQYGISLDNHEPEDHHGNVCKYCDMAGLVWAKLDSGWRLLEPHYQEDGLRHFAHVCKEYMEG
jgi:hypothetical protein